jgi:hypothetical protein
LEVADLKMQLFSFAYQSHNWRDLLQQTSQAEVLLTTEQNSSQKKEFDNLPPFGGIQV